MKTQLAEMEGAIPWTREGWADAVAFLERLTKTPKKEWPRRKLSKIEMDGDVYEINQGHPSFQLLAYLKDTYGESAGEAHAFRLNAIMGFLQRHEPWLTRRHLRRENEIALRLLDVLLVIPFRRGEITRKAVEREMAR